MSGGCFAANTTQGSTALLFIPLTNDGSCGAARGVSARIARRAWQAVIRALLQTAAPCARSALPSPALPPAPLTGGRRREMRSRRRCIVCLAGWWQSWRNNYSMAPKDRRRLCHMRWCLQNKEEQGGCCWQQRTGTPHRLRTALPAGQLAPQVSPDGRQMPLHCFPTAKFDAQHWVVGSMQ